MNLAIKNETIRNYAYKMIIFIFEFEKYSRYVMNKIETIPLLFEEYLNFFPNL